MPNAQANGITIHYQTLGNPENPPMVLIMGLASQMVRWPEEFCQDLVDQNLYVIRFDNRDIGLSTQWNQAGKDEVAAITAKMFAGETVAPPYTLSDMARDVTGLMDHLGLEKAHICGLSMGGMIAQTTAINHPDRVLTLTSMQSSPSNPSDPSLPRTTPEATEKLLATPPLDRDGYIQHTVESFRVFATNSPLYDPECEARMAEDQFDRGLHPLGVARQFLAVSLGGDRLEKLSKLTMPALVVHGTADTLIPSAHGEATAKAIPGARLLLVEGMGHGMAFPSTWKDLAREIGRHTNSL
ncbi:MAG: alpha/beta hydrolase [Desulfatibacillum sp.]|nr:alpha/beta hydrolase [Desulfatibacillum sp.]